MINDYKDIELKLFGEIKAANGSDWYIVQISAGIYHSLALDSNGKIYAWGLNNNGQLGNGKITNISYVPVEVDTSGVLDGKNIVQVIAGIYHSLALDSNGKVYSWGGNVYGILGNGSTDTSTVPVEVADGSVDFTSKNITQVSCGQNHSLALDENGRVYSWGSNTYGILGNGSTNNSNVPVEVVDNLLNEDGNKIIKINAGFSHSLALGENGKVYSWGYNNNGQLGDGTTNNRNVPVLVADGDINFRSKNIVQISSGGNHSLALDVGGKVCAWGYNNYGQLGNGTSINRSVPQEVGDINFTSKSIVKISAGRFHSLALDSESRVYAWGGNWNGQLGDGTNIDRNVPVEVYTLGVLDGKNIVKISAGESHSLALDSDGNVYAWGYNDYGQLGDKSTNGSNVPVLNLLNLEQYEYQPEYAPILLISQDNRKVLLSISENEDPNIILLIEYKINKGDYELGEKITFLDEGIYVVRAKSINSINKSLFSEEIIKIISVYIDENITIGFTGLITDYYLMDYGGEGIVDLYPSPITGYVYVEHTPGTNIYSMEIISEQISSTITKVINTSNYDWIYFDYNNGTVLNIYEEYDNGLRLTLVEDDFGWIGNPVDLDRDYRVNIEEICKYLDLYVKGFPILESFKDKAIELWLNGEYYERLDGIDEPDCWVNLSEIPVEDGVLISDMVEGSYISLGGRVWTVVNKSEGYVVMTDIYDRSLWNRWAIVSSDNNNLDGSLIFNYLRENFENIIINSRHRNLIENTDWNILNDIGGNTTLAGSISPEFFSQKLGILSVQEWDSYKDNIINNTNIWTRSPLNNSSTNVIYINSNNNLTNEISRRYYGVKPTLNLKNSIRFNGDGDLLNPYYPIIEPLDIVSANLEPTIVTVSEGTDFSVLSMEGLPKGVDVITNRDESDRDYIIPNVPIIWSGSNYSKNIIGNYGVEGNLDLTDLDLNESEIITFNSNINVVENSIDYPINTGHYFTNAFVYKDFEVIAGKFYKYYINPNIQESGLTPVAKAGPNNSGSGVSCDWYDSSGTLRRSNSDTGQSGVLIYSERFFIVKPRTYSGILTMHISI
jgi:alpha-tubulin suppressor-like RCC1 family protein